MAGKCSHENEDGGQRTYWRVRMAIEVLKAVVWGAWEEAHHGWGFPWF